MSASSRNTRSFGVARGSRVRISVILRPYACIPTLQDILSTSLIPQFSLPARERIFHPFVSFHFSRQTFFLFLFYFIFHLLCRRSLIRGYFARLIDKMQRGDWFSIFLANRHEIKVSTRCWFIAKLTSGNIACSRVVCDTLLAVSCESLSRKLNMDFVFISLLLFQQRRCVWGFWKHVFASSKAFCRAYLW